MTIVSQRQESLLGSLIRAYIASARPVSSGELVERDDFDLSPATIRHDMADLTEAGYLEQPHTSAGRIPTERAWRWYLDHRLQPHPPSRRQQAQLRQVADEFHRQPDQLVRQLAKTMAELAVESVLVAYGKDETFYTGLSNLFHQPEFENVEQLLDLSRIIDHLDEMVAKMYDRVGSEVTVLVGRDNPFSAACGTIVTRYALPRQPAGLIGILGPLRQNYGVNLGLMRYTQSLLQTI
ncbi:MAG: DeoR family transcriptional regulator [Candidatus Kerfeldbacteria bacterium]|nr:DeoR family transcriptional regulator [Candidatus Kerfeldbacteria bacterium]